MNPHAVHTRAAIVLAALLLLGGCASRGARHGAEPVTRAEAPKLTETQERIVEAREQSALDPQQPYWPYRLGEVYAQSDSLAHAETALRSCLARDPAYLPALMLLSKLYYDAGRYTEGALLLDAARTRSGAFPDGVPPALIGGLALHYEALGRHDLAEAVVKDASRAGEGTGRSALVYVTLRGEHPEKATDLARTALDAEPRSAANHNNYGITRLRAGDPKAARDAFLRAIELDPKLSGPYYNLAIVERFFFFNDDEAARWLKAYRERSSEDPDGLFGVIARGEAKPQAAPAPATGKER
jgi:tetratricopeptide (TPR) repeat protein